MNLEEARLIVENFLDDLDHSELIDMILDNKNKFNIKQFAEEIIEGDDDSEFDNVVHQSFVSTTKLVSKI